MAIITHTANTHADAGRGGKKQRPADRHRSKKFTMYMPAEEKRLLEELSLRNERDMSVEVLRALRAHFRREGLLPPAEPD